MLSEFFRQIFKIIDMQKVFLLMGELQTLYFF